jgi:hypothetical protein
MLLDSEHAAWLRANWKGGTSRGDKASLAGGLRKTFKISHQEASESVKVFLANPEQGEANDQDIVDILQEESVARARRIKRAKTVWICVTSFMLVMVVLMIIFHGDFNNFSGIYGVFGVSGAAAAATGRHKMAARAASKLSDKRVASSLIDLLDTQDKGIRELLEEGLSKTLPLFEQEDYDALSDEQKSKLFKSLAKTQNMNYAVGAMGLLRRNAGTNAIPTLETVAEGKSALRKKDGARAQSLASMALADIRMRAAKKTIDARVQQLGGSLTDYTLRVLGDEASSQEVKQQS